MGQRINIRQGGGENRKLWAGEVTLAAGGAVVQTGLTRITEAIGVTQLGAVALNEGFSVIFDGGEVTIDSSNAGSTAKVQLVVAGY